MHTILTKKNLYTVLFILSIYVIFAILFRDVLKDKAFGIELEKVPLIILAIWLFVWSRKSFLNASEPSVSNTTIILVVLSSLIFSLVLQKSIPSRASDYPEEKSDFNATGFKNPFYEEFTAIAKKNNLDLSFTKTAWLQRGPNSYKINTIFNEQPKSIDILFFGDSTIAWGLIPNVIEQFTGKKVAVYAYESNMLTKKTSQLFNKIARYYLKDNGLTIFSFANWTMEKDPEFVHVSKKEYDEMMQWENEDFIQHARHMKKEAKESAEKITEMDKVVQAQEEIDFLRSANETKRTLYEKYLSFNAFQSLYQQSSDYLKYTYGLYLKSPSFYDKYLEAIINPKLHAKRPMNAKEETKFIRWDMNSITQYSPKFEAKSLHSEIMPSTPMDNASIQINAEAVSKVYGQTKIYMVPLFSDHKSYKKSRNIYYTYYKDLGLKLCDLGTFQPKEDAYTMDGVHMGNTGGLMKSILVGKWLKNYLRNAHQTMPLKK